MYFIVLDTASRVVSKKSEFGEADNKFESLPDMSEESKSSLSDSLSDSEETTVEKHYSIVKQVITGIKV